nr:hypothetical protein [Oligoflexus tunisiensis]
MIRKINGHVIRVEVQVSGALHFFVAWFWMFAALNTVEPILELATATLLESDKPWSKERLPLVKDRVKSRLHQLSDRLDDADWLDGGFSVGNLIMVSVLLRLRSSGILNEFPNLSPMSPVAKRGLPTSRLSMLKRRLTPANHRPAD